MPVGIPMLDFVDFASVSHPMLDDCQGEKNGRIQSVVTCFFLSTAKGG